MIPKVIYVPILIALLFACVDPFEIKNIKSKNILVVEGVFSNQSKKHQIRLSRTTAVSERKYVRETGATVSISDEGGASIPLSEESPGIYETEESAASEGKKYTLHIKTKDGREYASSEVAFKDGVDIGDVYATYEKNHKGIQIYVDTEDPSGETRFYRWSYIETYQVNAPFPSVWVWLGGNEVTYRVDGIDTCYATDTLRQIAIKTTKDLEQDKVQAHPLRFIPETSYITRFRYSILVQQYCLSEDAYLYWDNLRLISEQQGSLSDQQPGSLSGNIHSITDPQEEVLGYFEACRVSEKRILVRAIDFYGQGLKFPPNFRSYCYEIAPILVPVLELGEQMERYKETMYIWEAYGDYPATVFELMPKSCCDCRDQGPTEKPPFF